MWSLVLTYRSGCKTNRPFVQLDRAVQVTYCSWKYFRCRTLPPTWLRCSIEFDSFPVFNSRGTIFSSRLLWLLFGGLWIRIRAVRSIFPFRPNLGDQTFSSMSTSSVSVTWVGESWHLPGALLLFGLVSLKTNIKLLIINYKIQYLCWIQLRRFSCTYILRLMAFGVGELRYSWAQCSSEGRYSCSPCFISSCVTPKLYLKTHEPRN